jgi:hypothetical protein
VTQYLKEGKEGYTELIEAPIIPPSTYSENLDIIEIVIKQLREHSAPFADGTFDRG